jgi:acetyl-CoA acyltransferase
MAADRIRLGEAEVMIAGRYRNDVADEPDDRQQDRPQPGHFREERKITRSVSGWESPLRKVAAQWQMSREDQDAFAVDSNQQGLRSH